MGVRSINDDAHFQTELQAAGIRLVVVDFTATWLENYLIWNGLWKYILIIFVCILFRCGPCQRIAPIFETFPAKYPKAIFLKVDVDKCQDTAAGQGVSAMPTFIFYRNKSKLDRLQGGNVEALESKIQQLIGSDDGDDGEDYGQGMVTKFLNDLSCSYLNDLVFKDGSECVHLEERMRMPKRVGRPSDGQLFDQFFQVPRVRLR